LIRRQNAGSIVISKHGTLGTLRSIPSVWLLAAALFTLLGAVSAYTAQPWIDEGLFANPAANLAAHGVMGTTNLEGEPALASINQHTYWIMPLYLVAQAGWYKLVGFSLLKQRALSLIFGIISLGSLYILVHALIGRSVALLASFLLAVDYVNIWTASLGRNDIMCSALGSAGLAAYLAMRNRHFGLAIFSSQLLLACSFFTHPNAILWIAASTYLMASLDRYRIKLEHSVIAAIPYLIGAMLWGAYILQDPRGFQSQILSNGQGRFENLFSPLHGVYGEVQRYLQAYGLAGHSTGHTGPIVFKSLVLLAYLLSLVIILVTPTLRREAGVRRLLTILVLIVFIQCFFNQKLTLYLVHVVPFYDAVLAVALLWLWNQRRIHRFLVIAAVASLASLQVCGVLLRARLDEYHREYLPAISYLRGHAPQNSRVVGTAALYYGRPFQQTIYDSTLGYYSGRKPDYIVLDDAMNENIRGLHNPRVLQFVQNRLTHEYCLVFEGTIYKIYKAL